MTTIGMVITHLAYCSKESETYNIWKIWEGGCDVKREPGENGVEMGEGRGGFDDYHGFENDQIELNFCFSPGCGFQRRGFL